MKDTERERLERLHQFEHELWAQALFVSAVSTKSGRGPLAGPVIAACVVIEVRFF